MSPPVPFAAHVAVVAGTLTAFVPSIAAVWARRVSWRDPVGQVAIAWTVMAVVGALGPIRFYFGIGPALPIASLVFVLFPLLLLPPTMTWMGPRVARWRWWAMGAWCVVAAIALATLGSGRVLDTVAFPAMAAGMGALSGLAIASRVHGGPERISRQGWFWILTAHVIYFVTDIFRWPLLESLVERHWEFLFDINNGVLWIYAAIYVMIARGIVLAREPAPSAQSASAPRVRTVA